jgi:hypothetical protein
MERRLRKQSDGTLLLDAKDAQARGVDPGAFANLVPLPGRDESEEAEGYCPGVEGIKPGVPCPQGAVMSVSF